MARPRCVLRNVPRAIAEGLARAIISSDNITDIWSNHLQDFICAVDHWHEARIRGDGADQMRCHALRMYHILNHLRTYLFCTETQWCVFIKYIDHRRLVGQYGTLQTLDGFVSVMIHACCPANNVSLLGIRFILSQAFPKWMTNGKNFNELLQTVAQCSDNYDTRRSFTNYEQFSKITCVFIDRLFNLQGNLQCDLIYGILWTFSNQDAHRRNQAFPLIDTREEEEEDNSEIKHPTNEHMLLSPQKINDVTIPLAKKDYLVFLPLEPTREVCYALSRTPDSKISVYVDCRKFLNISILFNGLRAILETLAFVYRASCVLFRAQRVQSVLRGMKNVTLLTIFTEKVKRNVIKQRFVQLCHRLYVIHQWLHRARAKIQSDNRKKDKNLRKKALKQMKKVEKCEARKSKVKRMFEVTLRLRVRLNSLLRKVRLLIITRTYQRQQLQFTRDQTKRADYFLTPKGNIAVCNFRMVRSLLKQILRIVVKCLSYFVGIVDEKRDEFHNYIQIFTFAIEPFLFYHGTCPNFKERPSVADFISMTQCMRCQKFNNALLAWLCRHNDLKAYIGCLPIFRYVTRLFNELHTIIDQAPDNLLETRFFVKFDVESLDKTTYQVFCATYADLSITWCMEPEHLGHIVEGWLTEGGRNIDLLDMLTQIQKTYMEFEKEQFEHDKNNDSQFPNRVKKVKRVVFRVNPVVKTEPRSRKRNKI